MPIFEDNEPITPEEMKRQQVSLNKKVLNLQLKQMEEILNLEASFKTEIEEDIK